MRAVLVAFSVLALCGTAQAKTIKAHKPVQVAQLGKDVPSFIKRNADAVAGTPVDASTTPITVDATSPKGGDFISTIVTKLNALNDKVVADIDVANGMATEIDPDTNRPKDEIAAACYPAAKKFIVSLKANVPTGGTPGVVTLFERKRLLVISIKKGLPTYLTIGCAPLLGDEIKILVGVVGMAGINLIVPGGGLAALAAKLPILGLGGL
jgi:hypothetical protein